MKTEGASFAETQEGAKEISVSAGKSPREKRAEKRRVLREFLPTDLQIRFSQKRPGKDPWEIGGKLLSRRHSAIEEDKIWAGALKAAKEKNLDQFEELRKKLTLRREDIADRLELDLLTKDAMERCFKEGRFDLAGKIAVAIGDLAAAKDAMERCFKEGWFGSAGKIAVAIGDLAAAKNAMERCFKEGWFVSAGEIAVAIAEKDPAAAKNAMERCLKEKQFGSAGKIAVAIAEKDPAAAKDAMERCFKEGWFVSAGKIAVAIAEKDPAAAKDAMERCFKEGWFGSAGKIAVAIAEKDPAAAKDAMERCFKEGWFVSAGEIAVALQKRIGEKPPEYKRLLEALDKEGNFGKRAVVHLLRQRRDLGDYRLEFLPRYLAAKKTAEAANAAIEESKKWKNYEEFFHNNNSAIADIFAIDAKRASQLLISPVKRGLSFAESSLELYEDAAAGRAASAIREYIANNPETDGYAMGDLLEIGSAYSRLGIDEEFSNILAQSRGGWNQTKSELNKKLLRKMAERLNVSAKIADANITAWDLRYFQNLITNREMLKNDEEGLALCEAMLKAVFENRFPEFISDTKQEDEVGQEVAKHNAEVKKAFEKAGVKWNEWDDFAGQVEFEVGTAKKTIREALFEQLARRLDDWKNALGAELRPAAEKDIARLKQQKNKFDPGSVNLAAEPWFRELLPSYAKTLTYLQKRDPAFSASREAEEMLQHIKETVGSLARSQQEEQSAKKTFVVRKWARDPRRDLFQGNATHCCISVGVKEATARPETILQYLADKGINVAEAADAETGEIIAQTWLFVSLDKKGEPVLVADNFEVNKRYPAGANVNRGLREAMFRFLKEYASSCGIKKVVLGDVGTNDVETGDLTKAKLPPIKKLGGFLNSEEYYLETLGKTGGLEIVSPSAP